MMPSKPDPPTDFPSPYTQFRLDIQTDCVAPGDTVLMEVCG